MASEESLSVRDMIGFKQTKVQIEGSGEWRKKKPCRVKPNAEIRFSRHRCLDRQAQMHIPDPV